MSMNNKYDVSIMLGMMILNKINLYYGIMIDNNHNTNKIFYFLFLVCVLLYTIIIVYDICIIQYHIVYRI